MRVFASATGLLMLLTPQIAHADALKWADGYWGTHAYKADTVSDQRNCKDSPVHIRIDVEERTYWSKIGDQDPRTAKISQISKQGFTIKYNNEERLMDDGRPHIWTLHFVDQDTFYWVREDWKAKGPTHKTAKRYRCSPLIS